MPSGHVLEVSFPESSSKLRDHHGLEEATYTVRPCHPSLIVHKIPTESNPTLLHYKRDTEGEKQRGRGKRATDEDKESEAGEMDRWIDR